MSNCVRIRKKKRRVCVGDMKDAITLQSREITAPLFNIVDFDENFQTLDPLVPEVLALIETVNGKVFFDGVNTETPVTHHIYISFQQAVTAEVWILFENRRFDILRVEDFEERHEIMKLVCVERGLATKEASKI